MDELIEKIKEVEKEARDIVLDTEHEVNKMLDDAKFQANLKLDKAGTKAYSIYTQLLKKETDEANQKKEEILNKKIEDFYNQLGDIDSKKNTIIESLNKKIKNWIK